MAHEPPRILVVEDELLIALSLQEMLEELGFSVELTSTLDHALDVAARATLQAAILDYNLASGTTEGVAEILTRRRVPFAVASGMDQRDIPMGKGGPVLAKPYDFEDVRRVVGVLTAPQRTLPVA